MRFGSSSIEWAAGNTVLSVGGSNRTLNINLLSGLGTEEVLKEGTSTPLTLQVGTVPSRVDKVVCLSLTLSLQPLPFGRVPSALTGAVTRSSFMRLVTRICCPDAVGDIIHFSFQGHLDGASWEKHLSEPRLEKALHLPED